MADDEYIHDMATDEPAASSSKQQPLLVLGKITEILDAFTLTRPEMSLGEIQQATGADDPIRWFIGGRFAEPAGYSNGVAALFIGGLWPALFLGSLFGTVGLASGALTGRTWSLSLSSLQWKLVTIGGVSAIAVSWLLKWFVLGN